VDGVTQGLQNGGNRREDGKAQASEGTRALLQAMAPLSGVHKLASF